MQDEADGFNSSTKNERESTRPDGAHDQSESATDKSVVCDTFNDADASTVISIAFRQSNSATIKDAHFEAASRLQRVARGTSFDALRANMELGKHLYEVKKLSGHGNFESDVEARLGIKAPWRTRLMKVGKEWPNILTAIEWAKATNRITRPEYSVDSALALLKEWEREVGGKAKPAGKKISDNSNVGNETFSDAMIFDYLKLLIGFLLSELARARQRIAFLESEFKRRSEAPYTDDAPCPNQLRLPLLTIAAANDQPTNQPKL